MSGGKYELGKLNLSECNDKALSVGEKSTVKLSNLLVSNSNIGLSSKDSSIISIDSANIKNTEICFEAKRKKQQKQPFGTNIFLIQNQKMCIFGVQNWGPDIVHWNG